MEPLRDKLIRLAEAEPALREDIHAILKSGGGNSPPEAIEAAGHLADAIESLANCAMVLSQRSTGLGFTGRESVADIWNDAARVALDCVRINRVLQGHKRKLENLP